VCYQELPLNTDGSAMDDMQTWNIPHKNFEYICLPDGDVIGYCSDCGAYHLPGDLVLVLTPEEFLRYLELYLNSKYSQALKYLSGKPNGKHSH